MKKIPYVDPVAVCELDNSPVLLPDGTQRCISQFEFFLGRLADGAFSEGKEGLDAISFVVVTRLELDNQREMAKERGFWLLEDDRAAALQRATLRPRVAYNAALALCILPLAQTVEKPEPA